MKYDVSRLLVFAAQEYLDTVLIGFAQDLFNVYVGPIKQRVFFKSAAIKKLKIHLNIKITICLWLLLMSIQYNSLLTRLEIQAMLLCNMRNVFAC